MSSFKVLHFCPECGTGNFFYPTDGGENIMCRECQQSRDQRNKLQSTAYQKMIESAKCQEKQLTLIQTLVDKITALEKRLATQEDGSIQV